MELGYRGFGDTLVYVWNLGGHKCLTSMAYIFGYTRWRELGAPM
jgi:hypothetical protein